MSRYMLTPPPNDPARFKEGLLYCWAAGLASFLNVANLGSVGYADIIAQNGAYMNADGTIPESGGTPDDGGTPGGIGAVFANYNVYSTKIYGGNFTYDYVANILRTKGWFIIMYWVGGDMGHTQVVYGVGVPDDSSISVFDPMTSRPDYLNISIASVAASTNMYVAWAAWAGP